MTISPPSITVSLVTYNALRWLPACLASLWAQELPPVKVIIRDNASTDGTVDWLHREVPARRTVELVVGEENLGFARAHNLAIAASRGDLICLLNQDIVLDPRFLARASNAFADPTVGSVQGKLYRLTEDLRRTYVIDSTGLAMGRNRRVVSRGQGRATAADYAIPEPIFGADGACPVYRLAALDASRVPVGRGTWEYFDEDFFMYKEDVDLAWRLQLFGWKTMYVPDAVAWHARGAGESAASRPTEVLAYRRRIAGWIKRHSWRNHRLMQLKNEVPHELVEDLPRIVFHELLALAYLVVFDPRNLAALVELIRRAPEALRKRRYIQRNRVADGIGKWLS